MNNIVLPATIVLPSLNYDLMAGVHLLINLILMGICIRRLGKMHEKVLLRVKVQYIGMVVVAAANGFAPLFFQQWPTLVSIAFSAWVLFIFSSDAFQWKDGPPKATECQAPHPELP